MIKNIVFDMGNVLVRFDPELFMDRYSLTGEDRKLIRNEVFRSVEWTMLDRGVIDEEIAEQRILPRLPERLHDAACGLIEKMKCMRSRSRPIRRLIMGSSAS